MTQWRSQISTSSVATPPGKFSESYVDQVIVSLLLNSTGKRLERLRVVFDNAIAARDVVIRAIPSLKHLKASECYAARSINPPVSSLFSTLYLLAHIGEWAGKNRKRLV